MRRYIDQVSLLKKNKKNQPRRTVSQAEVRKREVWRVRRHHLIISSEAVMIEIEVIRQRKGCSLDAGIFVPLPDPAKV